MNTHASSSFLTVGNMTPTSGTTTKATGSRSIQSEDVKVSAIHPLEIFWLFGVLIIPPVSVDFPNHIRHVLNSHLFRFELQLNRI